MSELRLNRTKRVAAAVAGFVPPCIRSLAWKTIVGCNGAPCTLQLVTPGFSDSLHSLSLTYCNLAYVQLLTLMEEGFPTLKSLTHLEIEDGIVKSGIDFLDLEEHFLHYLTSGQPRSTCVNRSC